MIRILIADDANLIRQALNIYFEHESDLEIVGTAENGKTALDLVEKLKPDIVLMDMEMPEMNGLTATKIISQRFPRTKVLIISSHNSRDYIDKALYVGANGYFIKNMPVEELSAAIKLIHQENVQIVPTFSEGESYIVLPDSLSNENHTKLSPELVLATKKEKSNSTTREPEKISSFNPSLNKSLSSIVRNWRLDRHWSKLSSFPLTRLNKFSPYINSLTNRKKAVCLFTFGVLGIGIFPASTIRYKITVRANAEIHSTNDIVEDWQQEQQFFTVGAVSRSPNITEKTDLKEQELQNFDNNLPNGSPEQASVHNQQPSIPSREAITKISPSRVPLIVKASVPSQDIAKVEKNQEVQLKLFACPYAHYGTLQGKTIDIVPQRSKEDTLISKQNSNSVDSTYEVTIEPASMSLYKAQHECPLKSGMKAKADIIIQEETILALILRKARLIN